MAWRFRKSVRIAPGVRINVGKRGLSTSIGGKGATVNLSHRGTRTTVGVPGTGLSHSSFRPAGADQAAGSAGHGKVVLVVAGVIGLLYATTSGRKPQPTPAAGAAAPTETVLRVQADAANCRAAPDAAAAIRRTVPRGESLIVRATAGAWTQVTAQYEECWIASRLLGTAAPARGESTSPPPTARTASGLAGLRAPTAAGAVVASAPAGARPRKARKPRARRSRAGAAPSYFRGSTGSSCPCNGGTVCIGPRGGRYCITSGGNKRYGV